jgi:hypothetical protein
LSKYAKSNYFWNNIKEENLINAQYTLNAFLLSKDGKEKNRQ